MFLALLSVLFGGMILYGVLSGKKVGCAGIQDILNAYGLGGTELL